MIWILVLALIGGCVATPLQQGNLKIVRYSANKDGLYPQNEGIPIAPQPIVYNPQQPFVYEPSPLTYSSVGGSVITERDQQRHINIDDEIEAREEAVDEEPKPVEDQPKVDSNNEPKDETVVRVDDQKPVQSETAALVGSSVVSNEQLFPNVVSGQRRLIEPQPQPQLLYGYGYGLGGLKAKGVPPHTVLQIPSLVPQQHRVIYHNLNQVQHQQQVPIQIEEQRITGQGVQVRKPVVQYQINPFQQPYVPREWLRKPIQSGVKGQHPIQYFIQPVIPSDLTVVSNGQKVDQPQVQWTLQSNVQGVKGVQQKGQSVVQEEGKVDRVDVPQVPKRQDVDGIGPIQFSQPIDIDQLGVQDQGVQGVQVQGVQHPQQRPDSLSQKQGVKSGDHSIHKVVVQTSQQQVPVVGGQQLIGYQIVGHQPQQILVQQPVQQLAHSGVQYVQPVSDIQRYYQYVQSGPVQSIGQQIPYAIQSQQGIDQLIPYSVGVQQQVPQQVSHQVIQSVRPIESPAGVSGLSVGGLQGSQRIQGLQGVQQIVVADNRSAGVKGQVGLQGQDLRVNPVPVDQRQQRSFIGQQGVKGLISV